jgi:hypothetical protein
LNFSGLISAKKWQTREDISLSTKTNHGTPYVLAIMDDVITSIHMISGPQSGQAE